MNVRIGDERMNESMKIMNESKELGVLRPINQYGYVRDSKERTNKRMNEWMNEWMDERTTDSMIERTNEWMNEWMNDKWWMNERKNEWMNERMNEWMNDDVKGWVDEGRKEEKDE